MTKKRVVVISDLHCGHEYGLTPPDWWMREDSADPSVVKKAVFQRELWQFYTTTLDKLRPIDILIVNGDAIEGKGERSGGVELITPDRHEQVRMARVAIEEAGALSIRILYGTRYHVGKEEDFEATLKDSLRCDDVKIEGHGFYTVNGNTLDVKHKVPGSSIPHGRHTAIARANLWNAVWSDEHERQPRANIFIRSHVHYFGHGGGTNWMGITTPALCYNSHYGVRECEGVVHVGLVFFDFDEMGGYVWRPIFADFAGMRVQPESL